MAICYECGERFYGSRCSNCGWEAVYNCYGCDEVIDPEATDKCRVCGWFVCPRCGSCGCNDDRPLSNEEKLGFR